MSRSLKVKQTTPQTLSLDTRTKSMLDQLCERLGVSRSGLVREWIITEAAKHNISPITHEEQ